MGPRGSDEKNTRPALRSDGSSSLLSRSAADWARLLNSAASRAISVMASAASGRLGWPCHQSVASRWIEGDRWMSVAGAPAASLAGGPAVSATASTRFRRPATSSALSPPSTTKSPSLNGSSPRQAALVSAPVLGDAAADSASASSRITWEDEAPRETARTPVRRGPSIRSRTHGVGSPREVSAQPRSPGSAVPPRSLGAAEGRTCRYNERAALSTDMRPAAAPVCPTRSFAQPSTVSGPKASESAAISARFRPAIPLPLVST